MSGEIDKQKRLLCIIGEFIKVVNVLSLTPGASDPGQFLRDYMDHFMMKQSIS